jgi:hypothetical protein
MIVDDSRLKALEKEGWNMRFVAGEPRLSEAVELYRESGFEVLLEPVPGGKQCGDCAGEEAGGECRACFDGFEDHYKIIFTRLLKETGREQEEIL